VDKVLKVGIGTDFVMFCTPIVQQKMVISIILPLLTYDIYSSYSVTVTNVVSGY
jgi:hypothetical protein